MELNSDYLRKTWLPWLATQFIDPSAATVDVKTTEPTPRIIFSNGTVRGRDAIQVPFNFQGHPQDGRPAAKRPVWQLEVWPRTEALQRAVHWSELQGFAVAVSLDVLLLACVYTLIRYTRQAHQLAEAQFNFVSATSHELRTPLTVIRGAAHNLERGIAHTPEAILNYASLIRSNAEQLTDIVEQILAFATTQKTRLPLSLQRLELAAVLDGALTSVQDEVTQANIKVEWLHRDEAVFVLGDAAALQRAFLNLISNAVKHGGSGGWVGIEVKSDRALNQAVAIISDRGPGIPVKEHSKIFDAFYRGQEAVNSQKRGSGIGLSLVREIVAEHKGIIAVQPGNTSGARFVVTLPLAGFP